MDLGPVAPQLDRVYDMAMNVPVPMIIVTPIVSSMDVNSVISYCNGFGDIVHWDMQREQHFISIQFKQLMDLKTILGKRYHRIVNYIVSIVLLSEHSNTFLSQSVPPLHISSFNDMLLSKIIDNLAINDLCSVAETCLRFKQLAELMFSTKFDKIILRAHDFIASKTFSIFGHLITELDVDLTEPHNVHLNFIADTCGKHLRRLSLWMKGNRESQHLDNNTKKKVMHMFWNLQHLEIYCQEFFDSNTTIDLLSSCSSLESLSINCTSTSNTIWNEIDVRLPKLNELKFHLNLAINDKGFDKWLKNNPNIRQLYIDECTNLSSFALNIIVRRLPALEKLTLGLLQHSHAENRSILSQLKIKSLGLLFEALPTMNIIFEAGIPIESLNLWFVHVNNAQIERIISMKSIRELTIFSYTIDNSHLKVIADNLPLLSKLTLGYSQHVTIDGLENMLLSSKQISYLHLFAMVNIDRKCQYRLRSFVTQHLGSTFPIVMIFD